MKKRVRIGDLLVEQNVITSNQLEQALYEQKKTSLKLGRILTDLGFVTEDNLLDTLSDQMGIPVIDLKHVDLNADVVRLLPESFARRFRAIVLEDKGDKLVVGFADASDLFAVDELERILKRDIERALVREAELLKTIDLFYRRTEDITNFAGELKTSLAENEVQLADLSVDEGSSTPVVKLLNSIFKDAVQIRASDIHIEPDEKVLRIRQRIDGVLQEHVINERSISSALIQRLKLISNLDISEKRLPQDGRFNVNVEDHRIDVRISILPTQYGEAAVMRILDQSAGALSLSQVGMSHDILERFRQLIHRPHGMILVTGPTGSGKTTTLYGALSELNVPEKKVITVEDPVEYRLPRITQVQINDKIGLNFASVLRSALRQDPDIVMVGEIRDQETAQIALRAAMTGHMVLSTLHTNDAITSALRLIDMGAEGYLAATALRGVIAQRLVRRICNSCKTLYQLTSQETQWLLAMTGDQLPTTEFYTGKGCPHCNQTGYQGRIGVYELLILNEEMVSALRKNDPDEFALAAARVPGFKPLVNSALEYAMQGVTSVHEVFRVAETLEDEVSHDDEMGAKHDGTEEVNVD